jgi:hypothetical protein
MTKFLLLGRTRWAQTFLDGFETVEVLMQNERCLDHMWSVLNQIAQVLEIPEPSDEEKLRILKELPCTVEIFTRGMKGTYMQCATKESRVLINKQVMKFICLIKCFGQFIVFVIQWSDRIRLEEPGRELQCHVLLVIVKLLHEMQHKMTFIFLNMIRSGSRQRTTACDRGAASAKHEGSLAPDHASRSSSLKDTPEKIGNCRDGRKVRGDSGYALEESIFGGRIRHLPDTDDENPFAVRLLL